MKTIIQTIATANYMADAAQVERLAGAVVDGQTAAGTYLRVILAHMQAQLGKTRRGRRSAATIAADGEAATTVLDNVHAQLYESVLKGVGPEDLEANERNRRATFARTAASTVRYFIRNGGDVRSVDVTTVSKFGLRSAVAPERSKPVEGESRIERTFRNVTDKMVRVGQTLLERGDPVEARARIEAAMDALETLLETVPEKPQPQRDFGETTFVGRAPPPGRNVGGRTGAQLHKGA